MSNEIFRDDIARKIYENAIVSIQLGVEDYLQANELHREQRLISSVRNLYAGVLLLFKSYLAEESCDSGYSLLKRDVEPRVVDGKTIWIGKGKKTVDFHQIKTNILALGAKCDLQLLEGVRNYRNDIEHYYAKNSKESVEGFVADIFILSTDFMRGALGLSKDEMRHELTDRIWNVLYHSKQVVDKARSRQKAEFDALNWYDGGRISVELSLCPNCGTAVLQLDNIDNNKNAAQCKFRCRACGDSFEYTELMALLQIVDAPLPSIAATRPNTALALCGRARPAGLPAARSAA